MEENKTEFTLEPRKMENHDLGTVIQYQLALPIAKRFQKDIGETCNKKFKNGAQMAVTVAAFIFRSMLVHTTRQLYKDDIEGGKAFISIVYDQAKKDAHEDWTTQG